MAAPWVLGADQDSLKEDELIAEARGGAGGRGAAACVLT